MSYVYSEFPRMLYHQNGAQLVVKDEAECSEALANGWTKKVGETNDIGLARARVRELETQLETARDNLAELERKTKKDAPTVETPDTGCKTDESYSSDAFVCSICGGRFGTSGQLCGHMIICKKKHAKAKAGN